MSPGLFRRPRWQVKLYPRACFTLGFGESVLRQLLGLPIKRIGAFRVEATLAGC